MSEVLILVSAAVRMMLLLLIAPMAWWLLEIGRRGMGLFAIGTYLEMARLFALQVLKYRSYADPMQTRELGLILQSPQVSLIPEILMLAGALSLAIQFHTLVQEVRNGKFSKVVLVGDRGGDHTDRGGFAQGQYIARIGRVFNKKGGQGWQT